MTLRVRLMATLVILVTFGLVAADVATYAALRSFLVRRVDQQLQASIFPAAGILVHSVSGGGQPGGPPGVSGMPSGTYIAAFDASDQLLIDKFVYPYEVATLPAKPALPASIGSFAGTDAHPFTVGSVRGGVRYRVLVTAITGGESLVVAIPLTEVTGTLRHLLVIALFVTLGVLAAMALLSWWTVRRGLRPLERIEVTAGAIAAGDLSRRVDQTDPRTEVGRLGVALNVMLGRIEEAMDERRASEEALRRFLADASHELRTPLTSIRGYAELFRRGADASPADTALAMRRIEQEGERMGVLVEDLLFLARAGQSRPIVHEPVDLTRVATDAVHDASAVDPSREITLESPPAIVVTGDDTRLRQVVANLIANALAHTPAGTPVTVRIREDGGWAELEVSDRGPGLSADQAAHVFEPFYRADPARVRVGANGDEASGAGLGLAIVVAIAEAHAGSVRVISEPGDGATFVVRLPMEPIGPALEPEPDLDARPEVGQDDAPQDEGPRP